MEYNFVREKEFKNGQILIADATKDITEKNMFSSDNAFFALREQDNYSFNCYTHTKEGNISNISIVLNDPEAEKKISKDGKSHCYKLYNYVLVNNGKIGIFDGVSKEDAIVCDVANGLYSIYIVKTKNDIIQAIEIRK